MPHLDEHSDVEGHGLEPIAIVGMACRLPGSLDSASKLWEALKNKQSMQTPKVPSSRFNVDAYLHENLERPGSFNVPGGYFLDGSTHQSFDPSFFGIAPVEAMWLDPQQRKMLEVSYECLEAAGVTLETSAGSNTGVFVGSFTSDYQQMSICEGDFRHAYAATGVDPGLISTRISHAFNFNGPALTINTACSSSIYAIHNACNVLRARDCSAAIAGGVNLVLTVDQHINTAKLGVLSPTSTCHSFDAAADGYGRAEGAGALYLKRLSDAIRDGDPVRGVIRTSAVNTNGRLAGAGITHPSGQGQERAVRAAYVRAGLDPARTAYVECHGTGTKVGDPVEARAVAQAMNDTRPPGQPLVVGAIKANIGHSEAASGIFAVMKAAMMTEQGVIPGVCGLRQVSPAIHEDEWNMHVARETEAWPATDVEGVRRAGVSSFGYGGTNGHVVVEAVDGLHPLYHHGRRRAESPGYYSPAALSRPFLIGLSAHDRTTLTRNIAAHAQVAADFHLPDLAYTLLARRSRFAERAFTVATDDNVSPAFELSAFTMGTVPRAAPALGFIFTGQGAQWQAMGARAAAAFHSFAETIRALDRVLQRILPDRPTWTLEAALLGSSSVDINDPEVAQPTCTAVQIAIVDLFARWGILPCVAVGHSSGEIAAAYSAGLVSAPAAIVAAFLRGRAVKDRAPKGSMLAVGLGTADVAPYLTGSLFVACQNSPSSTTLSGTPAAVADAKRSLAADSIFARELPTGKAYHSPQMDGVAEVYERLLAAAATSLDDDEDDDWRRPRARWFSSVTGAEYVDDEVPPSYWSLNLRNRVRFDEAVAAVGKDTGLQRPTVMVEVGPHSALAGPFKQTCQANQLEHLSYLPSLVRNQDGAVQLLKTAGALFLQDYPLDVEEVNALTDVSGKYSRPLILVDLPPYQWNYEKEYWAESRFSKAQRNLTHPRHDLLGNPVVGLSDSSLAWKNTLRHRDLPWLSDHRLGKEAVFPAAAHLSLGCEALRQVCDLKGIDVDSVTFRDVAITAALVIPDTGDGDVEIQTRLTRADDGWFEFAVESFRDEHWNMHSQGLVAANFRPRGSYLQGRRHPVDAAKLTHRASGKRWYDAFRKVGFEYGPSFQALGDIRSNGKQQQAAASVRVATESGLLTGESRYVLHPSTVDGCLQLVLVSIYSGLHQEMKSGAVPIRIEELSMWIPSKGGAPSAGNAVAWTESVEGGRYFNTHASLSTPAGEVLLEIKDLRCVLYEAVVPQTKAVPRPREPYMETVWRPDIADLGAEQAVQVCPPTQSEADTIAAVVELIQHKRPIGRATVLGQVGPETLDAVLAKVTPATSVILGDTSSDKLSSIAAELEHPVNVASVVVDGSLFGRRDGPLEPQDLVVVGRGYAASASSEQLLDGMGSILSEGGTAIFSVPAADFQDFDRLLRRQGFAGAELMFALPEVTVVTSTFVGGSSANGHASTQERITVLTSDDKSHGQLDELAGFWRDHGCRVHTMGLSDPCVLEPASGGTFIIDDVAGTLFESLTEDSFNAVKAVLTSGAPTLWLTRGVNQGKSVAAAMSQGLLRAVKSEQASARILLLDYDIDEDTGLVAETVLGKLKHLRSKSSDADAEFWLHNGIVHIPRILPHERLNAQFSAELAPAEEKVLEPGSALEGIFVDHTLVFSERESGRDEARLQVEYASLESRDPRHLQREPCLVAGKILQAGVGFDQALVGQRAVAFAAGPFVTSVPLSGALAVPYSGIDGADLVAALPAMVSATNAVLIVGRVEANEHVVLLPAPLSFVTAAVALKRAIGFGLTIVARNEDERQETALAVGELSDVDVLTSESSAVHVLLDQAQTDVIVSHDFGVFERECWRRVPPMARYVLNNAAVHVSPDPLPFLRGAAFLPAAIMPLFRRQAPALQEILRRSIELVKEDHIKFKTPVLYDVGSLGRGDDLAAAQLAEHESVVVHYRYGEDRIKVQPSFPGIELSPDAAYLMVGCLGGLGRSLTAFMMERGARDFVFLSRSGTDKPEAAALVDSLVQSGARVQVFRSDASNATDVSRAVAAVAATRPIRGVVHAAMVLQDGIFETMTFAQFQAATVPKADGARVLAAALGRHHASRQLDFFILTSSISAALGNPGQANYCAANSHLDALARHLALALPEDEGGIPAATSLALPMVLDVGVVAESAGIEAALERKAMYGIDEREMLRGFEAAMGRRKEGMAPPPPPPPSSPSASSSSSPDARHLAAAVHLGDAHIIMGLEPARLAAAMRSAGGSKDDDDDDDDAAYYWRRDARLRPLRHAADAIITADGEGEGGGGGGGGGGGIAVDDDGDFAKLLAAARRAAAAADTDANAAALLSQQLLRRRLRDAVAARVARKMAGMLLIPAERFAAGGGGGGGGGGSDDDDASASLASFGLDSMVGAELRSWLFARFGLEVSFRTLLGPRMTLGALGEAVVGVLVGGGVGGGV